MRKITDKEILDFRDIYMGGSSNTDLIFSGTFYIALLVSIVIYMKISIYNRKTSITNTTNDDAQTSKTQQFNSFESISKNWVYISKYDYCPRWYGEYVEVVDGGWLIELWLKMLSFICV